MVLYCLCPLTWYVVIQLSHFGQLAFASFGRALTVTVPSSFFVIRSDAPHTRHTIPTSLQVRTLIWSPPQQGHNNSVLFAILHNHLLRSQSPPVQRNTLHWNGWEDLFRRMSKRWFRAIFLTGTELPYPPICLFLEEKTNICSWWFYYIRSKGKCQRFRATFLENSGKNFGRFQPHIMIITPYNPHSIWWKGL